MTSLPPAIASDRFNWSRVAAVMHLMWPRLRTPFIVYLAVGIASAILVGLVSRLPFFVQLLPFALFIPCILFYIAPIFATCAMSGAQFTSLPATSGEKLVALSAYGLVILPVAVYAIAQVLVWITMFGVSCVYPYGSTVSFLYEMHTSLFLLNLLSGMLPGVICLYTGICNPGKKWKPALMAMLTLFALGVAGGLYGIILSVKRGFEAGYAAAQTGSGPSQADIDELAQDIVTGMFPFVWVVCILSLILTGLFLYMSYRRIATRQD